MINTTSAAQEILKNVSKNIDTMLFLQHAASVLKKLCFTLLSKQKKKHMRLRNI